VRTSPIQVISFIAGMSRALIDTRRRGSPCRGTSAIAHLSRGMKLV